MCGCRTCKEARELAEVTLLRSEGFIVKPTLTVNNLSSQKDTCRNNDVKEQCGLNDDLVTRAERVMLQWFGHLERMNESRLIKHIFRAHVCDRKLHRVRPDGTCECRRRVTCAMDDAWRKSSRHRMSQETVTGRFPSLLPGRRRLAAAGWSKELRSMT
ncbi:hypothetical protein EVAR_12958_1 [Eumeta japonica]|uniref:Uncharacterized protein n=1 Tax=Eumeta variegata TaxID=151549 RepID=A0A4C1TWV6_EUMVA|nr:hypothetical protein EVAR_12958_1 [Eumeta japonica]